MKNSLLLFLFLLVNSFISFSQAISPEIEKKIEELSNIEKVKYLSELCWELNEKSTEKAIFYGEYALKLADSLGFYSEASKVSNFLGVAINYKSYDNKKAWNYFRDALNYAVKSNDSIQLGYAYDNFGYMYLKNGDISNAQLYVNEASKIFSNLKDSLGIAYVSMNKGLICNENKQFENALDLFGKAKLIFEKFGIKNGVASSLACTGDTYLLKGEWDLALKTFQNQLEFTTKSEHKIYKGWALKGCAKVFYNKGDFKSALENQNNAIDIYTEKNDYYSLISMHIDKALTFLKLGKIKEGETELQIAEEIAEKLGLPQKILEIFEAYIEFYRNTESYEKSVAKFQYLLKEYNIIFSQLQKETIKNENQRYDIKRRLELANLNLKIKKDNEKYLIIIFLLLMFFLSILWWRYKKFQSLNKKLNLVNKKIIKEIKEKDDAVFALKESEKKLQVSNTSKDKLFSIIAHDLKSPFNSLIGFSDILVEQIKSNNPKNIEKYAEIINTVSKNTYDLLKNLLDWSKGQNNGIKLNIIAFNLSNLIQEKIEPVQKLALLKNIKIVSNVNPKLDIVADKNMLTTILLNLISNAIKYSFKDGIITIGASKVNNSIEISVKDSGVGISQENISKLFNLETNFTTNGTANEKGTGLGLMICKDFVEKHGGKLWVESSLNKGSIFKFTIPILT